MNRVNCYLGSAVDQACRYVGEGTETKTKEHLSKIAGFVGSKIAISSSIRIAGLWMKTGGSAFDAWRDEEQWLRRYCPMCGSLPAMAQLVGVDPGRWRLLSCGCCSTRWRYRRIGCPFCESADDHQLSALAIEGEKYLRIDYCQFCRAYLKTYDGEGDETLFLADWTSLHLDVIARDRGLKRLASSLYEL